MKRERPRALIKLTLGLAMAGGALNGLACDDSTTKTGTVVEKAPGQDAGEKASQDAMKAMMKERGKR